MHLLLRANIERVTSLLEEKPQVVDSPEVLEKYGDFFDPHKENWEPIKGDIEFEKRFIPVSRWKRRGAQQLQPENSGWYQWRWLAEAGAGKSTLVNLACRS